MDVLSLVRYSKSMFEDSSAAPPAQKRRLTIPMIIAASIIVALVAVIIILAIKLQAVATVQIPETVARKVNFTIYIPTKLPDNYTIAENSFSYAENTLLFQAKDSAGSNIVFTEQKKPANLNFDDFYKQNISEARTLSGVSFPAVIGKAATGDRQILSAVREDTWVLVTTPSPINDDDFAKMAKSLTAAH